MYDSAIATPDLPMARGPQAADFDAWCKCVRRLLGWSAGDMADWPDLYASWHTPRDAARLVVYGDGAGD